MVSLFKYWTIKGRIKMTDNQWPAWRYGPDGQSGVFESEADVPKGWEDHPTKVKGAADQSDSGTKTAQASPNAGTSPAKAAKTTEAKSQTATDPAVAAKAGEAGLTAAKPQKAPAAVNAGELDADGHPYDPALHAGTGSKTKAGLWRMKVGIARPAPAKPPLDL
jgi:hypothetical protein